MSCEFTGSRVCKCNHTKSHHTEVASGCFLRNAWTFSSCLQAHRRLNEHYVAHTHVIFTSALVTLHMRSGEHSRRSSFPEGFVWNLVKLITSHRHVAHLDALAGRRQRFQHLCERVSVCACVCASVWVCAPRHGLLTLIFNLQSTPLSTIPHLDSTQSKQNSIFNSNRFKRFEPDSSTFKSVRSEDNYGANTNAD